MKPQQFSGDSCLSQESKRTIREKIGRVYEAALVAMAGSNGAQNGGSSFLVSKQIERRRWNNRTEDPIRTMMFLGSWSHT